ncbi:TPA: hypothetical protein EYP66_11695, partial [Candidatus Poribacteria bacterium]|nr:hypothetical protein [Candidatus Poribacteria bacterium]
MKNPINRKVVGRMILANVLGMSINQYLNYVDRFITISSAAPFYRIHHIDERILAERPKNITGIVVREENKFLFYSPQYTKLNFELLWEPNDIRWKHNM